MLDHECAERPANCAGKTTKQRQAGDRPACFAAIHAAKRGEDIFDMRGIDRKAGCIVIVRPDQYVAHILPLQAREELARYFAGVLKPRRAAAPATPPASRPAPA